MSLIEAARTKLDELEVTNTSKMYTPFTLFCIYFAIYFNADTLGKVFLSNDWVVVKEALEVMVGRTWKEWFLFVLKVVGYSLGMLVVYGAGQASAAFIWGLANWANTNLSVLSNRSKYVAKSDLEEASNRIETLGEHVKDLYQRLNEYRKWKPEDIDELERRLKDSQDSYNASLDKQEEMRLKVEELEKSFGAKEDELRNTKRKENILEHVLKLTSNVQGFYKSLYNYERDYAGHKGIQAISRHHNSSFCKEFVQKNNLNETLIDIENINKRKDLKASDVNSQYGLAIALLSSIGAIEYETADESESLEDFTVSVEIKEPWFFTELIDSVPF